MMGIWFMKVQEWTLTGKMVCCAVGLVLFVVNSIVLITLFGIIIIIIIIIVLITRIIDSFKYRHYTAILSEVFPTSTKTVTSFDLEFLVGVGDFYLYMDNKLSCRF